MVKEWEKFEVGTKSQKNNWTNPDCQPFDKIAHVTHINSSIQIFKEGIIRPRLVYDESILNDKRILVNWLSPNHWSSGYRYGNIKFIFDWNKIIKNSNFYWVESIDYKVPACRILITNQDRHSELPHYYPTKGNGPWWYDEKTNTHYFNGNICLEVMLEKELKIEDCEKIEFVKHHPKWCSIYSANPKKCIDLGRSKYSAKAYMLANLLVEDIKFSNLKIFNFVEKHNDSLVPNNRINEALYYLCRLIEKNEIEFKGSIECTNDEAISYAKAIILFFSKIKPEEVRHLASGFKSEKDMGESIKRLVGEVFNIKSYDKLKCKF